LREVYAWLDAKPKLKAMRLPYHDVLSRPKEISRQIADFLETNLKLEAMVQQVDASLYRNRSK
jgi:hypothetical protein